MMGNEHGANERQGTSGEILNSAAMLLLLSMFLCDPAKAQSPKEDVAANPVPLVQRASHNELGTGNGHPYRYKLHKIDDGKITTKEIVETKDGDVARLISTGDKPLSPEAEQAEIDRLNNLLAHPEIQAHRHKKEQEDSDRANEMVRLLPDAFIYHYEGMVDRAERALLSAEFQTQSQFLLRPTARLRCITAWKASCGSISARSAWSSWTRT